MPGKKELPDTLKRSPKKAQETWTKTHDSAVETYGEGERAKDLHVEGASKMDKRGLAEAVAKKQK